MIMARLTRYTAIFLLCSLLPGCGPGRRAAETAEAAPYWVQSRPITPGYYTGIGWARKTRNVFQYQQTARQNALADLAGEISVTISSNSVLHAFESNLGFREDFTTTIEANTLEDLEGYEIVGTWEDENSYWVYYRLNRAKHLEITTKRRNDAVKLAAGHLEHALRAREQGQIRGSLVYLVNSMEAIRSYLDDPLQTEFRGENIQMGSRIFNELSSAMSEIQIEPENPEIIIRTGSGIPASMLRFRVNVYGGGPVPDFPLIASYSERPVRNNRARTGRDGTVGFSIDVVRAVATTETFRVEADIEAILAESTSDPVIRRLVRRFGAPGAEVTVRAEPPVIVITSTETNLGEPMEPGILTESVRKALSGGSYIISADLSEADYVLKINAATILTGEAGTYRNARLTGSISLEQTDGRIIYIRDLDGFRGSHFSAQTAGEEAFRQAARRTESSFYREIDDVIKRR